jgi:hypothetical protein
MGYPMIHPYTEQSAFDRLLLLIATLVRYPGIGAADPNATAETNHDGILAIQAKLPLVAQSCGIDLPAYSVHTLRKDLKTLRKYGLLDQRMYRWGYYLGTGAMSREELQLALQSLASQAQTDANIRQIFEVLERRLRGLNLDLKGQLFYPIRTHLNRSVVYSDPEEMMQQGKYRRTLFHQMSAVESAIAQGQLIKICRHRNPYDEVQTGQIKVFPIQLIHAEIAWYLLYEHEHTGHLEIERIDRFSDDFQVITPTGRGLMAQQQSLQVAHKLLTNGWGLFLGKPKEQLLELQGKPDLIEVWVKFFPPVSSFILEGDRRHPRQEIQRRSKGGEIYVNYKVKLPERSLNEFYYWVNRFMNSAQIIAPASLAERHRQAALELLKRYE